MEYLREIQASVTHESEKKMTIDQRLDTLVKTMAPCNDADAKGMNVPNPQQGDKVAVELLALVDVATKIMELDKLASKATEVLPAAHSEAKMWQELSLNTLQFSRSTLIKQQQQCIERLGSLVGTSKLPTPPSSPTLVAAVPAFPQPVKQDVSITPPVSHGKDMVGTLRKNLEALQEQNPMSILIVRRINRLGFNSSTFLEKHFAQFGDGVLHVLVAHSRVKPSVKRPVARVRPGGIGFVVMANHLDVDSLLAKKHVIHGVTIQVQRYEVRSFADFDECREASTSASDHEEGRDPSTTSSDHEEVCEA